MTSSSRHLRPSEVMDRIRYSLERKRPFSLVRIGDGENFVLAQDSVWEVERVLDTRWARRANMSKSKKGITLPNLGMRDRMVESIGKADVVGILDYDDETIKANPDNKRPLTDQVFRHFKLRPRHTCDALFSRNVVNSRYFGEMLRGKRVLLVTREAERLAAVLSEKPYRLDIYRAIPFNHYNDLEATIDYAVRNKHRFDIALVSCGVNAVVLAQQIAELTGNVALDMGKGMAHLLQ